jgi:hypothetical protein
MSNPSAPAFARLLPWLLAGLLVLAVAWLSVQQHLLQTERDALRTERKFADVAAQLAQSRLGERSLLAEGMINQLGRKLQGAEDLARLRIVVLDPPSGDGSGARAVVVWDPAQQTGWLTTGNLPPLAETEGYQIWIGDAALPEPVNGGIFHPRRTGRQVQEFHPDQPVNTPTTFAIGRATAGSGSRAAGPILLSGK